MDNTLIERIIKDATKLAERAIPAFEAQEKLGSIEPEYQLLKTAAEEAQKREESKVASFRTSVNKLANILVTRGILEDSNKVAFVEEIVNKPEELFEVTIKLAGELKAESFGAPDAISSGQNLDPFERLAVG